MTTSDFSKLKEQMQDAINNLQNSIAKLESELDKLDYKLTELAEQIKTTNSQL